MSAFASNPIYIRLWDLLSSNSLPEAHQILDTQRVERPLLNELLLRVVKACTLGKDLKESIEFLLNHGANKNCSDENGKSPLMLAAEKGYIELVETLLNASPDVNQMDHQNRTAVYYSIDNPNNAENADIVAMLVEKSDEKAINGFTLEGNSSLLKACEKGFVETIRILLEKANPNIYNEKTKISPLHIAIKNRNLTIIRLLLDSNADLNVRNFEGFNAKELIEKDQELMEKFKDYLYKTKNSIDFKDEFNKSKPNLKTQNKFMEFEEENANFQENNKKKQISKNFSLDNMEVFHGNSEFLGQPGNFNKSLTTNYQYSPQNSNVFQVFSAGNNPNNPKKLSQNKKNFYNNEENVMASEDLLECELMKNLKLTNQQKIMTNLPFQSQTVANNLNKGSVSPSSLNSKINRFTNRNNMNPIIPNPVNLIPNNANIVNNPINNMPNNNRTFNFQNSNNNNLFNNPYPGNNPINNPINNNNNNGNFPTNNNVFPTNNSSNFANSFQTNTNTNNNANIRTTHVITLDTTQANSLENMRKNADLLLEEKKKRKCQEDFLQEKKRNDDLERENADFRQKLKKKDLEIEKLSKELEKSHKFSRKTLDIATNTESKCCPIDFSDCLTVKDPAKTLKIKNLYQSFVNCGSSSNLELRLHEEILTFQTEVEKFHSENHGLFEKLIALVTESISSAINDCTIQTYGSFATELCLPYSDIDLVVEVKDHSLKYAGFQPNYPMILTKIQDALQKSGLVSDAKNIVNATVPVLKVTCTDEFLRKRLDITIKDMKHNGLNCVNLVKKYLEKFTQLKPLVLVLKYMMYSLDLSDTYQGGLNSYGLILMIVSMLQTLEIHEILGNMNLGSLLIRFFHLYGWEIDYIFLLINPSDQEKVEKPSFEYKNYPQTFDAQQFGPTLQEKLIIVDPTNPTNNVGRCTYKINMIKKAFFIAYVTLHENMCLESEKVRIGEKNDQGNCCILKRVFFLQQAYLKNANWMMNNYNG